MIYNNILETIGNTPIIRINNLAPDHVDMYVKAEYFNPLASVKDRWHMPSSWMPSPEALCRLAKRW